MGRYNYAFQNYDATKHVRAAIREKKISHKHARETAKAIKGLTLEKARDYMLSVVAKERAIPFRRFKNQVGHRSDPGMMSGRYPT
jgi:large subunit ribosomal protein L22